MAQPTPPPPEHRPRMSRTEVAVPLAFVGLGVTIVTALVFLVTPMIGRGLPSLEARLPGGRGTPGRARR